jgi:hypothetical protein
MIRILFVCDGPRDEAALPHLVATILSTDVDSSAIPSMHLGRGGGAKRKLEFALTFAQKRQAVSLVFVVDRDKAPKGERLRALREARDAERMENPPFPTALGEADPHGDAWLLDDPVAVRKALGIDNNVKIVTVRQTNSPKSVLDDLIRSSEHCDSDLMETLGKIAQLLSYGRCVHKHETGFERWVAEVQSELGPLVA